ncbi:MAG TPA: hypothetical protein VMV73_05060 [Candidatus Dormibacteraeota bacterium]|nr:hypothetical protein [Candidatus Dormibacteraeota bacterium]
MRCEVHLERDFDERAFEAAFDRFMHFYNVAPAEAQCSADVLLRYSTLFTAGGEGWTKRDFRHRGVRLRAAVLPEGMLVLRGEVDEDRMGDW